MKVILTESQYKKLLKEQYKDSVSNTLSKISDFTFNVIKDASNQLKFDFRFLLTYGAGIGAILQSVFDYLQGTFTNLDTNQIAGLTVMAIAVVFYENKDLKELLNKMRGNELSNAISYTEKIKNKFSHLLKVLGLSIHRTSNIVSYSFLVPVLSILIDVVTKHGIDSEQFEMLLEALSTSALIAIPGVAIRDVLIKAAEMVESKKISQT
jgi:DNA-binding protein